MKNYQVKTVYRVLMQADTAREAYQRVYALMRYEPGCFLAGVEEWKERPRRGLLRSLIFGWR